MKLLIMGAGYVGMELLKSLQSQSHEIFITTTQKDKLETLKPYGQVLLLDPNNDQEFKDCINACQGAVVLVAPKNSQNYETTYLKTALNITAALKNRTKPFYILYTSSTSVCEGIKDTWITEDMPLSPASTNGQILLKTEKQYLNSGFDTCILRLGGIYGPKRELLERAKRFSGKEMNSSGTEPTNHIHLHDILAALIFCIDHQLTGIYHLVNDDHPTRKQLYSQLCQSAHLPMPLWPSTPVGKGYKISNQKIKTAGFTFKHPLTS